jgi:hypothetical protein
MGAHDGRVREPSVAAAAARELSDDELVLELDGQTWRCRGCLRSILKCTCS